ncbi:MAG TPA: stage III sporulation protein AE [Pseudogracilibacillus sp.]|nr:stage III sporulation protein AE [Pseudogracilibacillus sp.]
MKKLFLAYILLCFCFFSFSSQAFAANTEEEFPNTEEESEMEEQLIEEIPTDDIARYWDDIQNEYSDYMPDSAKKTVKDMIKQDEGISIVEGIKGVLKFLVLEVIENGKLLGTLLLLTIFSRLLQTVHEAFDKSTVSKIAYFVVYIVLIYIVLSSFHQVFSYARDTVTMMSDFMIALLPLMLGLLASFGQVISVSFFHPVIIFMVHVSGLLISKFIFPLLYLSALLLIIGQLNEHFPLTHLADLFKTVSVGSLVIFLSLFLGIISIQGTASAVQDGVALKTTKFITGNFIPVVGRTFTDAADTVLSTLLLMKNTIGLVGLIILIFIAVFPAIKILVISFIYKLCAALLQPLGNNPVISSLAIVSKHIMYILACVITMAFMFVLTIIIMIIASNIPLLLR